MNHRTAANLQGEERRTAARASAIAAFASIGAVLAILLGLALQAGPANAEPKRRAPSVQHMLSAPIAFEAVPADAEERPLGSPAAAAGVAGPAVMGAVPAGSAWTPGEQLATPGDDVDEATASLALPACQPQWRASSAC